LQSEDRPKVEALDRDIGFTKSMTFGREDQSCWLAHRSIEQCPDRATGQLHVGRASAQHLIKRFRPMPGAVLALLDQECVDLAKLCSERANNRHRKRSIAGTILHRGGMRSGCIVEQIAQRSAPLG
jgi:hypothetical protein